MNTNIANKKYGVALLGATGSIGRSTQAELLYYKDLFNCVGVVGKTSIIPLGQCAKDLNAKYCITTDENNLDALKQAAPSNVICQGGMSAVIDLVTSNEVDIVVCAIMGTAGLAPVMAALNAGKKIALASKEVLALAGDIVMKESRLHPDAGIIPVDSEHSGLFQCLQGRKQNEIEKLWITASGGAFRNWTKEEIAQATPEAALNHPTWKMGKKITVDSASLMNKALEMIEASWLFGVPGNRIDAVINQQSIVHALAELTDGSFIAQMSVPDMRLAIRYALTYPQRLAGEVGKTDLRKLGAITFEEVDYDRFPALKLARIALDASGSMPAVLNAANEVAVESFLLGKIAFPQIWSVVEESMNQHQVIPQTTIEDMLEVDKIARIKANEIIAKL